MPTIKRKINMLCFAIIIICGILIAFLNVQTARTGLGNASAAVYSDKIIEVSNAITENAYSDEEKVMAIYEYVVDNFTYDEDDSPFFQHADLEETLESKKGLCFDFSNLFAALCRIQDIPCVAVAGVSNSGQKHQWNRVYFNETWYELDVTNDIAAREEGFSPFGFVEIEYVYSKTKGYKITKIF